ncbi:iron(III) transport system permease protein [Halohasta litchfieldiae]|jgi:iron(III) transport system permease protein|uniref:Iron(III) transport system permease protein n=1 Tax=Halohasta litchfieldiae TaxID=1073996 RepID=A0A1H6R938_9EURY|nr:iron ABC transporter permease [Halohasta litchfieldiae]ATW88534.1 iron(III) transport system permease protein [Halohasta litchfieldiae]SEI49037.1 iron(III) transport system permease protein [Halohasta litchfieldiae]
MTRLDRLTATGDPDDRSLGLTLLAGAVAASMILPLSWLLLEATKVESTRAWNLLLRPATVETLVNSLLLMAGVTVFSVGIGVPLAWLTVQTDLPFRRFWSVVVALPLVVPSYIGAFTFVSAFGPRGEFQSLLQPLGIEQLPEIYGLPGSILVITLYTYPYVYLTARAGLLSFDSSLLEAARSLNHGRWAAFRRVTLPHVRPAIIAGGLLAALYAVSDFGTPAIMRLPVFTRQIFVEFNSFNQDYASLLSIQLLGIVLVVLALESRIRPDDTVHGDGVGNDQSTEPLIELGVWRWPATLFPAAVTSLALLVPVWILGLWLVTADLAARPELGLKLEYVTNSVLVAGAAAVVAVLAAVPVAYFAARDASPLSNLFERATYVGFAVPGIVLALALVFFATGYETADIPFGPQIYQTLPLLVFAYVVRFMPQAVGSIRTSTLQVDPKLGEAARSLGSSPVAAFRKITLPLVTPGIVAGAALVFLTTMKELPATLILRPTGFETLVTLVWKAQESAYFQYAVVPSVLLLAVSGLSMIIILRQDGSNH